MAVSKEIIDKIINNADIVSVISSYIPLVKKGSDYKGVCPFHNDTDPSLSVSPTKKVFKCFSCGEAGNVVMFVQKFKHISFYEALKEVGKTVGIELDDGVVDERQQQISKLWNVMSDASKFYSFYLFNTKDGIEALNYLHNRHLNDDVIKRFEIGLSPDQNDLLFKNLSQNHLPIDIVQTGLVKDDKGYFDTFRNRIMFPIKNLQGNIVAFSGRLYNKEKDDKSPKYINSSDSIIFKKGQVLYNYYEAMNIIKNNDCCYLYEGFMDVIASYKAGVENCVASMGTALTVEQIKAIKKLTNNIVLCYDGDIPGINATKKAIKLLTTMNMNVKVVTLPVGIDPDEYINEFGEEKLRDHLINSPTSSLDYLYNLEKRDLIIEDSSSIESYKRNLFSYMHYFKSNTLNEIVFKKMSMDLNVPVEVLKSDFGSYGGIEVPIITNVPSYEPEVIPPVIGYTKGNQNQTEKISDKNKKNALKRFVKAEEELIKIAYNDKQLCLQIDNELEGKFVDSENHHLFMGIFEYYRNNDVMDYDRLKSYIGENEISILMRILESPLTPLVSSIDKLVTIVQSASDAQMVYNMGIYKTQNVITEDQLLKACKAKKKIVRTRKNKDN